MSLVNQAGAPETPSRGGGGGDLAVAPELFQHAVATLTATRPRTEVHVEPIRAPQRLAPWSYALAGEIVADRPTATGENSDEDTEFASGRLILLHDPAGHDAWDGTLRCVLYIRAELDAELVGDPLLPSVSWSWLTEALGESEAGHSCLGGTVTQSSSARFGDIAGPARTDEVELRASWTPATGDLGPHSEAFFTLLATAAGLPPIGVVPLIERPS